MTQARRKCWLSWSSGKDACYALHVLRDDPTVEVVGLMTSVNQSANRVAMHAVRAALLQEQADAAGLPLYQIQLPFPCTNEAYEAAMRGAVAAAKAADVEVIAFGDIFLEDVKRYREEKMADTGIDTMFPLWGRDTSQLARDIIDAGVQAVLTCIDPKRLPASFAGRTFDEQLLQDLPDGVDPCGENGEFHTFVTAAPRALRKTIAVHAGRDPRLVVERGGFVFHDIVPLGVALHEAAAEAAAARSEAAAADAAAAAVAEEEGSQCPVCTSHE
ncbi:MAG: hypothetical protein J3K34DRAFT_442033 [Monoraphidium minutum]|nr:MAG: hypothetical protein J3K34DRAFT_442033 [Monoraphidium minutum]